MMFPALAAFPLAALVLGAREWLLPAGVLLAVALAMLAWGYAGASTSRQVRFAALTLKVLGLIALAACLVEPLWTGDRARPGENLVLILADNSQSLEIKGMDAAASHGEQFREILTRNDSPWQVRLAQDFEVRRFQFDSRLLATPDYGSLAFDGRSSSLNSALRGLVERFQGRPIAAVLLLSDGNATDLTNGELDTTALPPVFPLMPAATAAARDVAVRDVSVSQTNFEDAPVSIQADVISAGYASSPIVCQLVNPEGKVVEEQTQNATAGAEPLTFRFQLKPDKSGLSFYKIRAAAKDELAAFDRPADSREATLANNGRLVMVDRGKGPYRVLYVSGRPNWEFKFLRRAIEEDAQVQLVGLIRIAKREPKFEWRSRPGESTNPLLRGFTDRSPDEAERYDQPVLIRLGTKDDVELRGGFPKSEDQLFGYHAVIVDDVEAEFFSRDQLTLLSRFVSERGGGFLMLGGQESFEKGQYVRTPIADLLPVYLDRGLDRAGSAGGYKLSLSRDGWLQPWVRLRKNEADETRRLDEMPEFLSMNQVPGVKPGAMVLATVNDVGQRTLPALVAHRYGRGNSGALLIGDLWRWRLKSDPENQDQEKAWRQMVRWLVSDVPGRVDLEAREDRRQPHQPVKLSVRVRDPKYQALDNATAAITVVSPDGARVKVDSEPSLSEPGLYEATYVPRLTGAYRAEVEVTDGSGAEVAKAEAGWTADPAADEFRSLAPNVELLSRLAARTGGETIPLDHLGAFVEGLPNRKMPVTEQSLYPLWHTSLMFLFAVGCLAGEWGLRRWKGLP